MTKIKIEINVNNDIQSFNAEMAFLKKKIAKYIKLNNETNFIKDVDFFNNEGSHSVKIDFHA